MTYISTYITIGLTYIIKGYQFFLSPWLGQHCRFTPSCSNYAIAAIDLHGPVNGLVLSSRRLCKCHPWHPGGFDPVPEISVRKNKLVTK